MNLEHVVKALDEQNKIALEMLAMMQLTEARNLRNEERQIEQHAVMLEVGRLAIEREKRMARMDEENEARFNEFRKTIPVVLVPPVGGEPTN